MSYEEVKSLHSSSLEAHIVYPSDSLLEVLEVRYVKQARKDRRAVLLENHLTLSADEFSFSHQAHEVDGAPCKSPADTSSVKSDGLTKADAEI